MGKIIPSIKVEKMIRDWTNQFLISYLIPNIMTIRERNKADSKNENKIRKMIVLAHMITPLN